MDLWLDLLPSHVLAQVFPLGVVAKRVPMLNQETTSLSLSIILLSLLKRTGHDEETITEISKCH